MHTCTDDRTVCQLACLLTHVTTSVDQQNYHLWLVPQQWPHSGQQAVAMQQEVVRSSGQH
jgi:hypothetical protein